MGATAQPGNRCSVASGLFEPTRRPLFAPLLVGGDLEGKPSKASDLFRKQCAPRERREVRVLFLPSEHGSRITRGVSLFATQCVPSTAWCATHPASAVGAKF